MKRLSAFSLCLIFSGYIFYLWSTPHSADVKTNETLNAALVDKSQGRADAAPSIQPAPQIADQTAIIRSASTGPNTSTSQSGMTKPLDAGSQEGASLKPLDSDLIKRVSSLAWISSPGYLEPESNDFDQKILDKSTNSPGWHPYKELRNGVYAGVLETRGVNPTSFAFWIYLNPGGPNGILPIWLRWSDDYSVSAPFNLTFNSPFSGQEVYLKTGGSSPTLDAVRRKGDRSWDLSGSIADSIHGNRTGCEIHRFDFI